MMCWLVPWLEPVAVVQLVDWSRWSGLEEVMVRLVRTRRFDATVSQILFSGMLHAAKLDDSIKRAAVLMTSLNPGLPKSRTPIANRVGASIYHIFMRCRIPIKNHYVPGGATCENVENASRQRTFELCQKSSTSTHFGTFLGL
jgi:hypothetical protein